MRAAGPVEGGEESVTCRVELLPAVPRENPPDKCVVPRQQVAPGGVPRLRGLLRRSDDVREEDRGEDAVRLRSGRKM